MYIPYNIRLILVFIIIITVLSCTYLAWPNDVEEDFSETRITKNNQSAEEHWFTQRLNHSNSADNRVWKQRYYVNNDYYKINGPIFMFIGAEGPVQHQWITQAGEMFENAKYFGAMMFLLEHRFYGLSQPMPDLSIENLAYLNTEQVLLDLAYFIEEMNKVYKIPNGTRWILFGCSHAGSIAAWMRYKHPHLIHGAVSSSAPILAKLDFSEYRIPIVVIEESLKMHSQDCVNVISNGTKEMEKMLLHLSGQRKLEKLFNLCDPIDSDTITKKDIANLYQTLADSFTNIIQYDKKNPNNMSVNTLCNILVDEKKGIPINRLAEASNLILKYNDEVCLDYKYEKMIEELKDVTLSELNRDGGRQWMYQSCTEYGFFKTSTGRPNLFTNHFPIDFFLEQCVDIFGPQCKNTTQLGVERTNTIFGALDLENFVTNVVFVHGSIDPWHPLGITTSKNTEAPTIFINGTAHCANIYPAGESDLPQLVEARKEITRLIEKWLHN